MVALALPHHPLLRAVVGSVFRGPGSNVEPDALTFLVGGRTESPLTTRLSPACEMCVRSRGLSKNSPNPCACHAPPVLSPRPMRDDPETMTIPRMNLRPYRHPDPNEPFEAEREDVVEQEG